MSGPILIVFPHSYIAVDNEPCGMRLNGCRILFEWLLNVYWALHWTGLVARSNKGMPINFLLNPYSDLVLSELVNPVLFDALPQKHQVKCHKNTK